MAALRDRDSGAYELTTRTIGPVESHIEKAHDARTFEEESLDQGSTAHLLEPTVLTHNDNATPSCRRQWKALGAIGICILSIGTFVIIGAMSLLSYFWCVSMRARDGEIIHPWIWSRIVFSDWASRVVTITAAVLRVSLALQMGVFTAMMASLMIERVGVPLSSVPLMSMLRAVSVSPFNLIASATFRMSWPNRLIYTTAVTVSIALTLAFQFVSTLLLSDFDIVAQSTPRAFTNISLFSNVGTGGSKLWNSQPLTYFRFAEQRERSTTDSEQHYDLYEDTGHILRALLPFEKESNRSRLQRYQGPAAVLDSRVVCIRPKITAVNVSIEGLLFGSYDGVTDFEESFARGYFGFENYDQLPLEKETHMDVDNWYFKCVVPTGGSAEERARDTSICALDLRDTQSDVNYRGLPHLTNTTASENAIFLVFQGIGSAQQWQTILGNHGTITPTESSTRSAVWEADTSNWTTSTDGIWTRLHLPETDYSMSVSACYTTLGASFYNVSMSTNNNGPEMNMAWDNGTGQFEVDVIRNQYSNYGKDNLSVDSRGILTLDSLEGVNRSGFVRLSAAVSDLPTLGKFIPRISILPSGTLAANSTGADSSRPLHHAHSVLFQDVLKESGSLAEALQTVLMVIQQMQYYDTAPQSQRGSTWSAPASYVMAEDRAIPVQWLGFSIVAGMIGLHFVLLFVTIVLFLALTNASWIGNAWMSISQVVSGETKDLIQKSTRKDDSEVHKMIKEAKRTSKVGLRIRFKVKRNPANERHEARSFQI